MELLKLCKQLPDFPYKKGGLKRRLEKRAKGCDSLSVKLAKDCHTLMIASRGTYWSDLTDVVSVKSAKHSTPSENDNTRVPVQNIALCENISRVDRDIITLRGEFVQDSEYLNNNVKTLTDSNAKLHDLVNKQANRILKLQNQINLIRDGKVHKELEHVIKRCNSLETNLNEQLYLSSTVNKPLELAETVKLV